MYYLKIAIENQFFTYFMLIIYLNLSILYLLFMYKIAEKRKSMKNSSSKYKLY